MAKQQVIKVKIYTKDYTGYVDNAPVEVKDAILAKNPEKQELFKNWVAPVVE